MSDIYISEYVYIRYIHARTHEQEDTSFGREEEGGGVGSGPGEARTILLFDIGVEVTEFSTNKQHSLISNAL